ncbi:NMCC_0638 family (lipo)protein [Eleftheria terrae]|uniref:NMCC_0638 family (lipo)protein n=1 Tax=Eleftheria terrae TaxID=1597781 RepID=UPI00263BA068|nr:hypothetical protein [Eleftheria terrae]WKB52597.1 hypothetical protein N7L95_22880 [Eleftheria terrae]
MDRNWRQAAARAARALGCAALLGSVPAHAQAQAQPEPQPETAAETAPVLPARIESTPLEPTGPAPAAAAAPGAALVAQGRAVARAFVDGCVLTEGDLTGATDWALSAGFEPRDAQAPEASTLLDGHTGSVFAQPEGGIKLYLVVLTDGGCTVWAEGVSGPAVHQEFQRAMAELGAKGARVSKGTERNIDRGGAWRRQLQLRYRRVGGSQDWGLNVVTTLDAPPGVQALHLARAPAATLPDPDGLPAR